MSPTREENKKNVAALLQSDFITEPTRKVLVDRCHESGKNVFFNDENFLLLRTLCDLLMDQDSEDRGCNIALSIDQRLSNKAVDGWRYDALPPDGEKYHLGLKGINEFSKLKFNQLFIDLIRDHQIEILGEIQCGLPEGESWQRLDSKLFFEDLLAETAEIYYSHPLVQESLHYVGMADAKGWTKIQLNEFQEPEKKMT